MDNHSFVSERIVNGYTYIAYRNDEDPAKCVITRDADSVIVTNLSQVWNDPAALEALF